MSGVEPCTFGSLHPTFRCCHDDPPFGGWRIDSEDDILASTQAPRDPAVSKSMIRRILTILPLFGILSSGIAQTVYLTSLSGASLFFIAGPNGTPNWTATQFMTGGAGVSIDSLTLTMTNANGSPSGGAFTVKLFSNTTEKPSYSGTNLPDAPLATFTGSTNPVTAGDYSYSLGTPYSLSAGTRYWIVASAPSTTGGYFKPLGSSSSGTSSFGWSVVGGADGASDGTSWSTNTNSMAVSIAASAIPEPSAYATLLGVAVLGLVFWRRRQDNA